MNQCRPRGLLQFLSSSSWSLRISCQDHWQLSHLVHVQVSSGASNSLGGVWLGVLACYRQHKALGDTAESRGLLLENDLILPVMHICAF